MEHVLDRRRAAFEIIVFGALAFGSKVAFDTVFWRFAGPVSLVLTLACIAVYLRRRGEGWAAFGLVPLRGARAKLLVIPQTLATFVLFGVAVGATVFGGQALGFEFMGEEPAGVAERWGDVAGNLSQYLLWLGVSWTAAAFGEEMFFRGFLITRFEALFFGAPLSKALAVLAPALVFGLAHFYYQGLRGLITTAAIGIAFGTAFLLFRRNLWPLVILHGIVDSLNFSALYFGWDV